MKSSHTLQSPASDICVVSITELKRTRTMSLFKSFRFQYRLLYQVNACHISLDWSSSSSFLISLFKQLMVSRLAFSLSLSSAISKLVFFLAASSFSLVFTSRSATVVTTKKNEHCEYHEKLSAFFFNLQQMQFGGGVLKKMHFNVFYK